MSDYKNPQYPLRIRQDVINKMRVVAYESSRSLNKEIEQACISYISDFEKHNGIITDEDIDNIK